MLARFGKSICSTGGEGAISGPGGRGGCARCRSRRRSGAATVFTDGTEPATDGCPGVARAVLLNFYILFVGAEECYKRGWAFTERDIENFRSFLAQETGSIPQNIRDEAWAFVANAVKNSTEEGSEAGCFEFKHTVINIGFPGVLDPETTNRKAPF